MAAVPPYRAGDADRRHARGVAVPVIELPEEPSFTQLRNQAKDLRRAVAAGQADAFAQVAEFWPGPPPAAQSPLPAPQLVVARRYGFPSWARLKRYVEVLE